MDSQDNAKKLFDEELQQVSGGTGEPPAPNQPIPPCPNCGGDNITELQQRHQDGHLYLDLHCNDCDYRWTCKYPIGTL